MLNEHTVFLSQVEAYVRKHPEVSYSVGESVRAGLQAALHGAQQRAADFESALAIAIAVRYKGRDEAIYSILQRHPTETSVNWDWARELLKPKDETTQAENSMLSLVSSLIYTEQYELLDAYLRGLNLQQIPTAELQEITALIRSKADRTKLSVWDLFEMDVISVMESRPE